MASAQLSQTHPPHATGIDTVGAQSAAGGMMRLEVISIETLTPRVKLFALADPARAPLPPATAGAHVELSMVNGLRRSYSLINAPGAAESYLIAVAREADSRGGSRYLHNAVGRGDVLSVSPPRNSFPLVPGAHHSVLIAGGIGITPIWAMMQQLEHDRASFTLVYCARSASEAAFLPQIRQTRAFAEGRVTLRFDDAHADVLDMAALLRESPAGSHFYCCGPRAMLDAYEAAAQSLPEGTAHLERFSAALPAAGGGFTVELARSGRKLAVAEGASILDVLLDEGLPVEFSCMEGMCGSCRVDVLDGTPDHRDSFLSRAEKAEGKAIMVCCSGVLGNRIVLDL